MKKILLLLLIFNCSAYAEIEVWYKASIRAQYEREPFTGVILYKIKNVSFKSESRGIYTYKIDTETMNLIKGYAPKGECYYVHTEGEWMSKPSIGDVEIVILLVNYTGDCGAIEPGYAAPGTNEYINFFKSVVSGE